MKFIPLWFILALTSAYGQTGFELIETGKPGKMRAECLPSEMEDGADTCKFVLRKGDYLQFDLLFQFDEAYEKNQTWETRDDSFLKDPVQISFYSEEMDELSSFKTVASRLDYTKIEGKDAVYLRFQEPGLLESFKTSDVVVIEINSRTYLFDLVGFASLYDKMRG